MNRLLRPQVAGFVLLVVLVLQVLPLPRPAIVAEMVHGSTADAGVTLRGFHAPELASDGSGRTFRWTAAPQATVLFEAAQRVRPHVLSLVVCGCSSARHSPGSPLLLELNEQPLFRTTPGDAWRSYSVLIPPHLEHPDHSLVASLHTAPRVASGGRTVGVAVDRAEVRQLAPVALAGPWSKLLLLAVLAGFGGRGAVGRSFLLLVGWLLLLVLYQPQFLAAGLLLNLFVVGTWLGWWVARRVPVWPFVPVLLSWWLVSSRQWYGGWILDDAYISFRYADNLLQGHGLVYNVGERVEGYTNFLWTVLVSGGMAGGVSPVLFAAAFNLGVALLLVAFTVRLAHTLVSPGWAWGAGALLACSSPFLLYTSRGSGMETGFFTLLILATLVALVEQRWTRAGLLAALTMLTRPDGVLVAGVGGGYALWSGLVRRPQQEGEGVRPLVSYALPVLLLYLPYFVWRWSYYGYVLPNTFYAKVGGTVEQMWRGVGYLTVFARSDLLLPAAVVGLLIGGWMCWRAGERLSPLVGLLAGFVGIWCSYVVLVGGDWMPGARFFVPLLPALVVLVVWGLQSLPRSPGRWRSLPGPGMLFAGLVLCLVLCLPVDSLSNPDSLVRREVGVVRAYRAEGRWIARHTPTDTLIVAGPAGAMPYYARRPTIDALGLNDEHIAHLPGSTLHTGKAGHEKTDPDYVLGRQPAIIPWSAAAYLRGHPTLEQAYHLIQRYAPDGATIRLFVRIDSPIRSFEQDMTGEKPGMLDPFQ